MRLPNEGPHYPREPAQGPIHPQTHLRAAVRIVRQTQHKSRRLPQALDAWRQRCPERKPPEGGFQLLPHVRHLRPLRRSGRSDNPPRSPGPARQTFKRLVAVNAWEELETWVLAGLDLPKDWVWATIRADISVKENYFEPLASQRRIDDGPGGGRKSLGEEAARRLTGMRQKCPEDLDHVALRLAEIAASV